MYIRQFIFLISLVLVGYSSTAQVNDDYSEDGVVNADSLYSDSDTSAVRRNTFTEIFSGKPGKAALYSLLIPGGGQIYNKRWWKLPLVYGLEGTAIYFIISNSRQVSKFDNCYRQLLDDNSIPCLNTTDAQRVFNARQIAKKNTEYSWIFFIAARLLTIFDAFVDRHFMDFDMNEDISFKPSEYLPQGAYLSFSLKIPIQSYKSQSTKILFP